MQEPVKVTGIVLVSTPSGEYDRRLVLLTKERGKITVFAKGARRQTSRHIAAAGLFVFGQFTLYPGRNAYTLMDSEISHYFEELRKDYEAAYYGMYFLELCDYYARENNDEAELLKLLYQSLRALGVKSLDRKLVRVIFELKSMAINGDFPGLPAGKNWLESTCYAVGFILETRVEKLYTFTVSQEVLEELIRIASFCQSHYIDRKPKSLEVLSLIQGD